MSGEETQLGLPKLNVPVFVQKEDPKGAAPGGSTVSLVNYAAWCALKRKFLCKRGSRWYGARWQCSRPGEVVCTQAEIFVQSRDPDGTAPGGSVVSLVRCVHSSRNSRAKRIQKVWRQEAL